MLTIKESKTTPRVQDNILWSIIAIILAASLWANYFYSAIDASLRVTAWIGIAIVVLCIARFTTQGIRTWNFAKESRIELRKVVWPTRQETIQTTLIVVGLVIVLSLIIWCLDSFLLWAIGLLTGQRG